MFVMCTKDLQIAQNNYVTFWVIAQKAGQTTGQIEHLADIPMRKRGIHLSALSDPRSDDILIKTSADV